jgi:predicted aspartyl protease
MLTGEAYERQLRFDLAAPIYQRCIKLMPRALDEVANVAASKVKVLRSFAGLSPVAIDDEAATPVHVVPFRLDHNKILVTGRLNGTATEFVVDTGAERTTLSYEAATRAKVRIVADTDLAGLGYTIITKFSVGRADLIALGDLRIRNVPVIVRPAGFTRVEADNRESFSPIALGLSVVIDYERQLLTLGRAIPDEPSDVTLPMRAHYLPMVRGVVNDVHPAYFVVDTGGELMSISQDTADQLAMAPQRHIPINVWGATGRDRDAFLLPGLNLDLGAITYRNVPLAVLNLRAPSVLLGFRIGGILGHGFLARYQVAMDFGRGEVRLRRNSTPN